MEEMFALLGFLFFMFLVLAATVEAILESFRGALEWLGFKWAKGKISLDSAMALSTEFAPNSHDLFTKLDAVKSVSMQIEKIREAHEAKIAQCIESLKNLKPNDDTAKVAGDITSVALGVKSSIEASEGRRIATLRLIAACIGGALVWISDFYVFQLLSMMPEATQYKDALKGLQSESFNIIVGGFAAAAGSSYWHDQLDKVRKLKEISGSFKRAASTS